MVRLHYDHALHKIGKEHYLSFKVVCLQGCTDHVVLLLRTQTDTHNTPTPTRVRTFNLVPYLHHAEMVIIVIWPLFRKMPANQKPLNRIEICWYQFIPRKLLSHGISKFSQIWSTWDVRFFFFFFFLGGGTLHVHVFVFLYLTGYVRHKLPSQGVASCEVLADRVILTFRHFSSNFISFIVNKFFRATKIVCHPFLPTHMTKRKLVFLNVHLYKDLPGNEEVSDILLTFDSVLETKLQSKLYKCKKNRVNYEYQRFGSLLCFSFFRSIQTCMLLDDIYCRNKYRKKPQ